MINVLSEPVLYNAVNSWETWVTFVFGLVFVGLGIWFMFLYQDQKRKQITSSRLADEKGYSHGSFKGVWMRHRATIFAFLVATFFIVGVSLMVIPFT